MKQDRTKRPAAACTVIMRWAVLNSFLD